MEVKENKYPVRNQSKSASSVEVYHRNKYCRHVKRMDEERWTYKSKEQVERMELNKCKRCFNPLEKDDVERKTQKEKLEELDIPTSEIHGIR